MSRTSGHVTGTEPRGTIALMAMLTVTEAADRYPLSRTHVRRLVAGGVLKGKKIGPVWTVDTRSIERYLAANHPRGRHANRPKSNG